MAWNTVSDIRHYCCECNQYRIFTPDDFKQKSQVLQGLDSLKQFFDQKLVELDQKPNASMTLPIMVRGNKEHCQSMISECQHCDRSIDRVNRQMLLLK